VVGAMPSAQRFLFCWKWTYNASVNIVDYWNWLSSFLLEK
jgi:hypothetical protein